MSINPYNRTAARIRAAHAEAELDIRTNWAERSWRRFVADCKARGITSKTAVIREARRQDNRITADMAQLIGRLVAEA